ncbi:MULTISPECIES: biopolymer transporter ExbD [Dyadobacter]|uniref:Biopolymer transporter ExbD n=1 Tax=Dyadobacter chenhuakuii TaxID=2909339 RepID=A0A9X1QDP2_9BACT|nr:MULTISPECIES: biopolymer transporter ExbD [Dyadobacter]MCE7068895.1 biopolymer transporter ExbD [Dyadobacter sp. CY327]MCF2495567.1 biopolymer transporter ExbD [Dyadobacter chenhuakuii]MCF2499963.1 biopolymer transporter ExbD [Dyadobacter chenhuakuii]MCF2520204.1 biopolymer transporter ExbD [Dyadobacter sp. CY351]USJ29603.1 biopolymer transporter ExbD [Dyadobacter chenhuakuii]
MAAIEESGGGGHGKGDGKVRGKKMSTRVDMTPMVDLGFLLITFFMLATTMSKPTSMTLAVPDKTDEKDQEKTEPLKASKVLTLFMGANDDVYYLDGVAADDDKAEASLKTTRYGFDLRSVIFNSAKRINAANPKDEKGNDPFVVVIKPTPVSTYKNMVDVLDEMAITKSKRYALVETLTDSEKKLLGDKIVEK